MDGWSLLAFLPLVLLTYLIGGIAGFGGTILAVAGVALIIDIKTAVPGLLIIGTVQSFQAMFSSHQHVDRPSLRRMVLWAAVGIPIGVLSAKQLNQQALSIAFGIVCILSGLSRFLPIVPQTLPRWMEAVFNLLLVSAGVIHGAFAAGGAPVVVVAQHTVPRKESFRATLFMFWCIMNVVAVILYAAAGRFTWPAVQVGLYGLPAVVLGTFLADRAAQRIPQKQFAIFVAILLIVAGFISLVLNLRPR